MRWIVGIVVASVAVLVRAGVAAQESRPDAPGPDAPVVVSMHPAPGDASVDPALTEVRLEFDRDMARTYSLVGKPPYFPRTTGRPRWIDERTCVLGVSLDPDRVYCLDINGGRFDGFRSREGVPAEPAAMLFHTAGDTEVPALTPGIKRLSIAELRTAITERYSHRDRLGLDWDALFETHRPALESSRNALEFMLAAREMLAATNDRHITLEFEDAVLALPSRRKARNNFSRQGVTKKLENGQLANPTVAAGRLPGGLGYILIMSFDGAVAEDLEAAHSILTKLIDAPGLVIDIRPNGGGDERLARRFAGRFIAEETPYARARTRDPDAPGGFTEEYTRTFAPDPDGGPRYAGPVCVLMGELNMSSAESFLLMMRQVDGCTLIGERSYGSSGNPQPHELSVGVTVMLPSWSETDLEGRPIEGVGVEPDVVMKAEIDELRFDDPLLKMAIEILSSQ